jgi:hypothetical protein
MPSAYEVYGAQQLFVVSKQLKAIGDKELQASMRRRLRAAAAPVVLKVKAKAAEHSTTIPATIGLSMRYAGKRAGAYIISRKSKMPPGHEPLPGLFEYKAKFRHPVYGDRENWVTQAGFPFLRVTVMKEAPELRRELLGIIKDVSRSLV